MSIPLRDEKGSLIGWTDKALVRVFTLSHQDSIPEKRPPTFVAGYQVDLPDGKVKEFGPSLASQVRRNKRHARRLVALGKLRDDQ